MFRNLDKKNLKKCFNKIENQPKLVSVWLVAIGIYFLLNVKFQLKNVKKLFGL